MKKVISLILVVVILLLVGCAETTEADTQTDYIQDNRCCRIIVDKKTGVNYIVFIDLHQGGITPRLNADGTPYVSGVNGNE